MTSIDWNRVSKFLKDGARRHGGNHQQALERTTVILASCGQASQSRSMAQRVGALALHGQLHVIIPCCPDYGHDGRAYTFKGGLGGDVSLLARRHVEFVTPFVQSNIIRATFVYADHEANDSDLCRVTGVSHDVFRERVLQSVEATRRYLEVRGVTADVTTMTSRFPSLVNDEHAIIAELDASPAHAMRIARDTAARQVMYARIRAGMSPNEMRQRTLRTAAQYIALGRLVRAMDAVVLNHTTVNLYWYLETNVGLLHNPVTVY